MIPALFVHQSQKGICWICRRPAANPSREHKIKASDLRRHFGTTSMVVGASDDETGQYRFAQGVGSRHLKYENPICSECNNQTTQESDAAYDEFVFQLEQAGATQTAAYKILESDRFRKGSAQYVALFRYFAKLLGCHLADITAPIPIHLSRFVAKKTSTNCIWLAIREDVTYRSMAENNTQEKISYAAHGGLVVVTKAPKFLPSRLYSTLTVGSVQFIFYAYLTVFEILELRIRYPSFVKWCGDTARMAIESPIPDVDLVRLGLKNF